MGVRVTISLEGGNYARFRPSYLDARSYRQFQEATEGTRYIRELRAKLAPLDKVPAILVKLRSSKHEGQPLFDTDLQPEVVAALQQRTATQWLDLRSAQARIERIDAELHARTGHRLFPFQKTGAQWLTLRQAALLADEQGTGKDQAVSEPVLTPKGWIKIGDIRVGDLVIGSNGKSTRVLGVFPQGLRKQYQVTLTDGTTTRCGLEHLWFVSPGRSFASATSRPRLKTLREMMERGLRSFQGYSHWFLPIVSSPIEFEVSSTENGYLHPYLIGALIANGGISGHSVNHTGLEEQREVLRHVIPPGYHLSPTADVYTYRITLQKRFSGRNEVRRYLSSIGLQGKRSWEKRIPSSFLFQSIESRKAMLAGLLDNDGTVCSRDGTQVEYNTSSPKLAEDVLHLVRSLGGLAWFKKRWPKYTYKGEKLEGRTDYRVRISLAFNPFRVFSKMNKYVPRTKYPLARAIDKVEECDVEESVCISVDAKDQLYVTNDFIVTHNTLQTIVALPASVPMLVVAPAVAKGVWMGEVQKWRPQLKVSVLRGRESFRWPAQNEMVVTNYDILPNIHDRKKCDGFLPAEPCLGCKEVVVFQATNVVTIPQGHLPKCKGFKIDKKGKSLRRRCPGCHPLLETPNESTVIVFDEAQYLKNFQAARTQQARAIAQAARKAGGRTWLLSGTPLENEPKDLWSVFQAAGIAEEAFGDWKTFVALFKGKTTPHGYTWGLPGEEIKERLRRVSLRRMRVEVLPQLPVKVWQEIEVEVDKKALLECERFLKNYGGIEKISTLLETEKIDFEVMSSVRAALATAKIPAMLGLVKEQEDLEEPLVVFSAHRAPIDMLARRQGWAVITGDVPAHKKTEIERAFQAGELKGIGCTIRAGGIAITLTHSNRCLFVDQDFKSTANAQAEDRICRIGADKKRGVIIMVMKANHPLDRRVTEILTRKTKLIAMSVDAASVGEDAPTDKELEEYVRKSQLESADVSAFRRQAASEEEKLTVEQLHTFMFEARGEERLAVELAEEASAIGLTDAQWILAARIAKNGKVKEVKTTAQSEPHVKRMAARMRLPKDKSENGGDEKEPKSKKSDDVSAKVERAALLLKAMTEDDRLDLFEIIEETYCVDCGEAYESDPKEHDCPMAPDEDDNEGEEDDDEDDSEDEAVEDEKEEKS